MNNEQIEKCLEELLNLMTEQENFVKKLAIEVGNIKNELLEHELNSKSTTKENKDKKETALLMLNKMKEIQEELLKAKND